MRRKIRVKRYIRNDGRPVRGHTRHIATRRAHARTKMIAKEYGKLSPRAQKYAIKLDETDAAVNEIYAHHKKTKRMAMKYPALGMIGSQKRLEELQIELYKNVQLLVEIEASSLSEREKNSLALRSTKTMDTAVDLFKSETDIAVKAEYMSAKDAKKFKQSLDKVQQEARLKLNKHKI